jgi:hypothetical protein
VQDQHSLTFHVASKVAVQHAHTGRANVTAAFNTAVCSTGAVCLVQLLEDVSRARAELQQPRLKLMALTAVQLRAAVKAVLLAPFTLPAALAARWQALFAGSSYENFLMSEGEQVWAWRNRTENERWFWEVLAVDR